MKKLLKKSIFIALILCIVFQATACNKDRPDKSDSDVNLNQDTIISKKPIEFSFFYPASKDEDGEWRTLKEAAKMTNVSLHVVLSKSNADFKQSFNLMLSSGNLSDIIVGYWPALFSKYGAEGAFVPLNDYIDQYAPNLKKLLDEQPDIKKEITSFDGNIYYIPVIQSGYASMGWFVRTDWLKKLNMKAPATKEELYQTLQAFRKNDPNGNGVKDEIPYFSNQKDDGIKSLYTLWNAYPSWYQQSGTVKYGPYDPEFKEAVSNVAKWYKEGLIDMEIFTRGSSARDKLLGDNVGGMTHDWFGSTALFNKSLKDKIPAFEFLPIAPPEGREPSRRAKGSGYGWAISTSCKDIVSAVKYFDFWFSEKGSHLINYGIEGEFWNMADGKPVFKPEMLAKSDFITVKRNSGAPLDIGYFQDFDSEKQWLTPIAVDGMKLYEEGRYCMEQFPDLTSVYTPKELERYNALNTPIETYVSEMTQKWVLGTSDINETYDGFIAQLETLNIKELINLQQTGYGKFND